MSLAPAVDRSTSRWMVLTLSTVAFTLMFNVWLMLGVLAPKVKESLGLSASQVEWLIATSILAGALLRLNFGIWADRYGGRNVMIALMLLTTVPTYLFSRATTYPEMLACALFFGLAGNAFTVGISWNSVWFANDQKGLALGTFGAGNVGASGTKLLIGLFPAVLTAVPAAGLLGGFLPGGWRIIPVVYTILLLLMVVVTVILAPSPDPMPGRGRRLGEMLVPLRDTRVWRFSLYYVVVFGAYVALSGWLPTFYKDTFHVPLRTAAASDGDVHPTREPAQAARRLAVGPLRPSDRHLRGLHRDDTGAGRALGAVPDVLGRPLPSRTRHVRGP